VTRQKRKSRAPKRPSLSKTDHKEGGKRYTQKKMCDVTKKTTQNRGGKPVKPKKKVQKTQKTRTRKKKNHRKKTARRTMGTGDPKDTYTRRNVRKEGKNKRRKKCRKKGKKGFQKENKERGDGPGEKQTGPGGGTPGREEIVDLTTEIQAKNRTVEGF